MTEVGLFLKPHRIVDKLSTAVYVSNLGTWQCRPVNAGEVEVEARLAYIIILSKHK